MKPQCVNEPGFKVAPSDVGFIVWDGWHGAIVKLPSVFIVRDIVAYGTTEEAAHAAVRLLSEGKGEGFES